MLPEAAFDGVTELIDHVTVWFEALVTVAVNCCCWPALKLTLCGLMLTVSELLPRKNTPLTTAFDPPVRVTLIFACPEMFQTKYIPLEKLEMLLVSNTALVFASRI